MKLYKLMLVALTMYCTQKIMFCTHVQFFGAQNGSLFQLIVSGKWCIGLHDCKELVKSVSTSKPRRPTTTSNVYLMEKDKDYKFMFIAINYLSFNLDKQEK